MTEKSSFMESLDEYRNRRETDCRLIEIQGANRHAGKTPFVLSSDLNAAERFYIAKNIDAARNRDSGRMKQAQAQVDYIRELIEAKNLISIK